MRLKELWSTQHRTWFVLNVEYPRSKLKEYKSPRLRDVDFHWSLIHLPRHRQILQCVFKCRVSACQLCTNLISGHNNRADGRFPIHHVQSVPFITRAFLLHEFIIYFIYVCIYLFNQRRLISKYDIMPAHFSEKHIQCFYFNYPEDRGWKLLRNVVTNCQ